MHRRAAILRMLGASGFVALIPKFRARPAYESALDTSDCTVRTVARMYAVASSVFIPQQNCRCIVLPLSSHLTEDQ